ncbi:hypothetical protein [Burkholderia contaminans]|uniref:hypothetical protein n=1 Tax=Burkholderia contaminans TaxID=488447 RepID=UPI00158CFDF5|nr:hypothetical protein [Burkholderia contaminans]ELK6463727.1 hypothetical protein [Burkholderia contaminans]
MELILLVVCAWLCSAFWLIRIPCVIIRMRRNSQDVWTFMSLGRLFLLALVYIVTAPLPLLIAFAMAGAGVSGSKAGSLEPILSLAWAALWIFLSAAAVALILAVFRLFVMLGSARIFTRHKKN